MSFFLSPFKFVFELIGFLISAAFVYGLALIIGGILIWNTIESMPKETVVEYVTTVEMHEVTKFVARGPELTCTRLSGCKTFPNAKTEKEYCPTCVIK